MSLIKSPFSPAQLNQLEHMVMSQGGHALSEDAAILLSDRHWFYIYELAQALNNTGNWINYYTRQPFNTYDVTRIKELIKNKKIGMNAPNEQKLPTSTEDDPFLTAALNIAQAEGYEIPFANNFLVDEHIRNLVSSGRLTQEQSLPTVRQIVRAIEMNERLSACFSRNLLSLTQLHEWGSMEATRIANIAYSDYTWVFVCDGALSLRTNSCMGGSRNSEGS